MKEHSETWLLIYFEHHDLNLPLDEMILIMVRKTLRNLLRITIISHKNELPHMYTPFLVSSYEFKLTLIRTR